MNNQAAQAAVALANNAVVVNFCYDEAYSKVAEEMNAQGYSCIAKAVRILATRYNNIMDRVNDYAVIGLAACVAKAVQGKK